MVIGIDASRANRIHKTGTEWYSYHLIKNLAQIDNQNEYILYADKPLKRGLFDLTNMNMQDINQEVKPEYDNQGCQKIISPHNNFKAKILKWPFNSFWTLGRMSIEMIFNKPDILFIPAHTLPLCYPKKSINTIHDVAFERDRYIYRQDRMGPDDIKINNTLNFLIRVFTWRKYGANSIDYLSWSTRFAIKHARKIITVSNFSKSEILDIYGVRKDKIKVIYNGYDKALYKKNKDYTRQNKVLNKYGLEKPFILYVGRIEKKKNTAALIEAFFLARQANQELKEKLVLIGNASFGYDEVKYSIEEFSLTNQVIMPGWVDEEDMPYIYSSATAFIFPSKHEGFGIPVVQAMGCEIPAAVSEIAVLKEVAGDAALYFNPYDVKSMAKAINKILKDENLRKDLIKKGNERIKKFSWKKCAQETLDVINSL